jgi:flagellar brake protein
MATQSMPLDAMSGLPNGLAEFRVSWPAEILTLLKQLADGKVSITLSTPGGARTTVTVWALDPQRGLLCLSADAQDVQMQGLLESDEVVAVAYLDNVKLQFELDDAVLVHAGHDSALNARLPREIFRFQRRDSFRVRPLINTRPVATFHHPAIPDMQLALRVIDVSIGGLALFLPEDVPPIEPGVKVSKVVVGLDGNTRLEIGLRIHHITLLNHESKGVRLGCEITDFGGSDERTLQRYIEQTQKARRLMAL